MSNRSNDDAIATALHPALTHLDKKVRLLFIDFSSAFNTIIPQQLIHKLVQLGLNTSLWNWLLDFLTGRPQAVWVGSNTSSTITLNTEDLTEDLSWTNNTAALAKKAQQRLYFLRKLRRARAPAPIMCTFYRGTIESILTSCITVWYGACNASCRKSLQRIVRAAEKIVGVSLPSPPSRTSTAPFSPAKPSALQVIPPTRHTTSSVCYHQGGDCGVSKPGPTDWKTASSIRLSGSWTPSRPCPPPLSYPTHHWTLTHPPPPPPTHTHIHTHTLWPAPVTLYSIGLTSFNYLFWQSDLIISSLHYTIYILHCLFVCFSHWFALYLPCALCHFIHFLYYYYCFFFYMSLFVYL